MPQCCCYPGQYPQPSSGQYGGPVQQSPAQYLPAQTAAFAGPTTQVTPAVSPSTVPASVAGATGGAAGVTAGGPLSPDAMTGLITSLTALTAAVTNLVTVLTQMQAAQMQAAAAPAAAAGGAGALGGPSAGALGGPSGDSLSQEELAQFGLGEPSRAAAAGDVPAAPRGGLGEPSRSGLNPPPKDSRDTAAIKKYIDEVARKVGVDPGVLQHIAEGESGYKWDAVNDWDSNARKGTPSKGMFQFIEPTFDSYAKQAREAHPDLFEGLGGHDWMDWRQQAVTTAWAIKAGHGSAWATFPG